MERTYSSPAPDKTLDLAQWLHALGLWVSRYWQQLLVMAFVLIIFLKKDVAINLQMIGGPQKELAALGRQWINPTTETAPVAQIPAPLPSGGEAATKTSQETTESARSGFFSRLLAWFSPHVSPPQKTDPQADNSLSGFGFQEDRTAAPSERLSRRNRQLSYVDRYADIARRERDLFGIPVSITLAQGLLESNAGRSKLALNNNNHFGIKCFSKSCAEGHCRNFSDDHHKDFFRVYNSPAESYRAHSELLQKSRYRPLKKLPPKDYKAWANGLQRAGYATDPAYARKLIYLIETLGLDAYDA